MRLTFFVLILCLCALTAVGQIANLPGAANDVVRTKKYVEFEGSPYLSEDWSPGTLTDSRGQVYSNVMLRYDTYKKNVEVSSQNGTLLVSAELYPRFTMQSVDKAGALTNRSFSAKVNPLDPNLYVEELVVGANSFFKQHKTEFVEETVTSYGSSSAKKVFATKLSYLFRIGEVTKTFKLSKSSFVEAAPHYKDAIEAFSQKNKSKMKSESDFIAFFKSLNGEDVTK